jgi:DNA-binding transcriptional regulator YbjK
MSATTAYFSNIDTRPVSSKLASVLRVLADRYDAKTAEKSKAKRKQAIHRMAASHESAQPNLAAELRFVAWSA